LQYQPAVHASGLDSALALQKYPAPHTTQLDEPDADHVGTSHTCCIADDAFDTQKYPALHSPLDAFKPADAQYSPAPHALAFDDPDGQYDPIGHTTCVDDDEFTGQ
jgi:hypothetical protein